MTGFFFVFQLGPIEKTGWFFGLGLFVKTLSKGGGLLHHGGERRQREDMKSSGFSGANIDFWLDALPNAYVSYCSRLTQFTKDYGEPILMYPWPTRGTLSTTQKDPVGVLGHIVCDDFSARSNQTLNGSFLTRAVVRAFLLY